MKPTPETSHQIIEHLKHGVQLFNDHNWFDAHEVWEEAWHLCEGDRKRFVQGLIQCAVALVHLERGNPRGVRNVYCNARTKFQGLASPYMAIDHVALIQQMDAMLGQVLALPGARFKAGQPKGQDLPWQRSQAPRIDWHGQPTI